ncbi:MAG: amino acid permease [Archangiaceae bacterium]|nr:amino acid permease [Archangiaceae bacterium]
MEMPASHQPAAEDALLEKLGYRADLKRTLSLFANFGIAFCYISPVVGVYSLFGYGLNAAGPAFVWGIPLVAVGQLFVALVFAEVASAYPVAGALYQWGKLLIGPRYGWMVGWIYGWALLVTIAAVDFAGAPFLAQLLRLDGPPVLIVGIAAALLLVHTIFNVVGVKASAFITKLGVLGEVSATIVIAGVLIAGGLPQPASVLLETAGTGTGLGYAPAFLAALLSPVWVFYGFESAGDVAEEVVDAPRKVPRAVLGSMLGAVVVTAFLMVTLVLAAPSIPDAMKDPAKTIGLIFEARLGRGLSIVMLLLIVFAYFSCATAIQAACSRLVFAYARDGVIPGAEVLKRVNPKTRSPTAALWFTGVIALITLCLTLLDVGKVNASAVIVAYASTGIYVSFQLIVTAFLVQRLRGWKGEGPFSLGRFGKPVAVLALLYGVPMTLNICWPRPAGEPAGWFPVASAVVIIGSGLALQLTQAVRRSSAARSTPAPPRAPGRAP